MPTRPSPLLGAAHVGALWALAFAQPLFDLLGRNSVFFVARGSGPAQIVAFALLFALGPVLAVWLLELALERWAPAARWAVHLLLLGLVAAALILQLIGQLIQRPAGVMLAAAVLLGAGVVALYARGRFMRSVLDVLSPAPVIVLVLFLVIGPTSRLVLPEPEPRAEAVEVRDPAPVVVLIFDELPSGSLLDSAGRIDSARFPSFARLAREATWYRDATTVGGFTSVAVPAILTGRTPEPGALPIASEQPESLFTLLGESHRMLVQEDATQLCPEGICTDAAGERTVSGGLGPLFADLSIVSQHLLLPDALRAGLPDVSKTFGGFAEEFEGGGGGEPDGPAGDPAGEGDGRPRAVEGGDSQALAMAFAQGNALDEPDRFEQFTDGFDSGDGRSGRGAAGGHDERPSRGTSGGGPPASAKPALHLLHIQQPHYPWRRLPDGRMYSPQMGEWIRLMDDDSVWQAPESVTDIALQRHLLAVGYTDRILGGVIAAMERAGIWDEALLLVASDHGGAMIPGEPRRNPTAGNMGQVAPVPLFIKAPDQARGRTVPGPFCTAEALPAVATRLGIEYPWQKPDCPEDTVAVADFPDGVVEAPFEQVMRQRAAYAERIDALFGGGRDWQGVLAPRRWRDLLGRPPQPPARGNSFRLTGGSPATGEASTQPDDALAAPEELNPLQDHRPGAEVQPADASAEPEELDALQEHRPGAEVQPALLQRGSLEGVESEEEIAIVADGRVAGVGPAFQLEDEIRYSILLPPHSLRAGENKIEVHRIIRRPGGEPGVSFQRLWP